MANTSHLKAQLSAHIQFVQEGEGVLVGGRVKPVGESRRAVRKNTPRSSRG
jgi:hypothetical protein